MIVLYKYNKNQFTNNKKCLDAKSNLNTNYSGSEINL